MLMLAPPAQPPSKFAATHVSEVMAHHRGRRPRASRPRNRRRCRRPCRAHVPEKISARARDGGNAERIAVENSWLAPAQRERNRRRRVKNAGVTLRAGAPRRDRQRDLAPAAFAPCKPS